MPAIILGVKQAMISELVLAAPGCQARPTRFFNHSFIPDVELIWASSPRFRREVYYRGYSDPGLLAIDIDALQHSRGVVFLGGVAPDAQNNAALGAALRRASELLVVEQGALEMLATQLRSELTDVTNAMLSIGRGYLTVSHALRLGQTLSAIGPTRGKERVLEALGPFAPEDPGAVWPPIRSQQSPRRPRISRHLSDLVPLRSHAPSQRHSLPSHRRPVDCGLRQRPIRN
ncbi:MAG TPA: hypothetical protein VFB78_15080 [Acidimicrobiales bacterium]|nr:hypothetical protein [Acidimicrobiales bacterium]